MAGEILEQLPPCQLGQISLIHEPLGSFEKIWQLRGRLVRIIKRRLSFMKNLFMSWFSKPALTGHKFSESQAELLSPGDSVIVKSKEQIRASLGNWNSLKGCVFMEEMWDYCGTQQKVLKRLNKFLDERDYHTKKVKGIVILENVNCQGTVDFGPCDRTCFFFWREEWLEKLN